MSDDVLPNSLTRDPPGVTELFGGPRSTRRPAIQARHAAVVAGHPPAALAAQRILDKGGNAVDAGVAAGICIGVLLPDLVSLGGVAPIIYYSSESREISTVSGVGRCGAHIGCFELFGSDRVRAIRDLKGRAVAVPALGSPPHIFLASILAHVGLDPGADVVWEAHPPSEAMQLLSEGRVDGYLGFPTDPQELRARHIGHVAVGELAVVAAQGGDPLSERECEVAVLIARGCTNREIAHELVIAEATAVRHVANILNSLGLRSRAQVAVWAVERGLVAARSEQSSR